VLGGRIVSSFTPSSRHGPHVSVKKKPPGLSFDQASGFAEIGVDLCILMSLCFPFFSIFAATTHSKKSACKFTQFQVRKVHENLTVAQPARLIFLLFFCIDLRVGAH
jgi:hypothetical protein